jgi:hypothetical protein
MTRRATTKRGRVRIKFEGYVMPLTQVAAIMDEPYQRLYDRWRHRGKPKVIRHRKQLEARYSRTRNDGCPKPVTIEGVGHFPSQRIAAQVVGISPSRMSQHVKKFGSVLTEEQARTGAGVRIYVRKEKEQPKPKKQRGSSEWNSFSNKDRSDRLALIP